jgi:simple sugar transport system ATP-binding protein
MGKALNKVRGTSKLIEARGISKFFGKVAALDGVDFSVGYNETVGLVGDNGAGKSTLIKILSGVYPPSKGEIYIKGKKINVKNYSVQKARECGIETVFQERALAEQQTLWRNIFMGREIVDRFGFLRVGKLKDETHSLMRKVGLRSAGINPDSIVKKLSGGEKQGAVISRALYFGADLVILDEPLMGLSLAESKKALDFVREIKRNKKSCILISHSIYHVYPVGDRFVILDRGKKVEEISKKGTSLRALEDRLIQITETRKFGTEA